VSGGSYRTTGGSPQSYDSDKANWRQYPFNDEIYNFHALYLSD
jgi:hypothetical protein